MCNLSTYENRIHEFAEKLDPFIFSNEGIDHAEIVFSEIYEHAKDSICIFCGNLSEQLTSRPKLFNSLSSYLDSGKELKLLIESRPEEMSPALTKIIDASRKNSKIQCRVLEDSVGINSHFNFNDNKRVHFTVADKRTFRLEIEPENYKAFCSFNNFEIGERLTQIFNQYFEKSQSIN